MRNPLSKVVTELKPSGIRKFFDIVSEMPKGKFDAAIVAVAHKQFRDNDVDWDNLLEKNHVIFDVKCILPREMVDGRL